MFSNEFLLLAGELLRINRCAVFDRHVGSVTMRGMMILKNSRGMADADRDDRTAGFCGDLERSLVERKQFQFPSCILSACALREDHDGNAGFDIINGGQDGLQTGFYSRYDPETGSREISSTGRAAASCRISFFAM